MLKQVEEGKTEPIAMEKIEMVQAREKYEHESRNVREEWATLQEEMERSLQNPLQRTGRRRRNVRNKAVGMLDLTMDCQMTCPPSWLKHFLLLY